VFTIAAETSFCTLNTTLLFVTSPEEITSSTLLKKLSLGQKAQRKYSIEKIVTVFFFPKKLIISRKSERSKEEITPKSREIESANSPSFSGLQVKNCRKRSQ